MLRIRDVYPGSRILIFTHPGYRIPDLGSRISDLGSRISDPGSRIQKQQQKRGVKKICCHNFLCSHKFHKIAHYFSFDVLKKKIIELSTQKIVNKLSKLWIWDLGSEIRDPEKTYSGSRIQGSKRHRIPDPGSGSATLDPWTNFFPPGSEFFPSRICIKEFKYFNPKNCFQALGNMIRVVHPGSPGIRILIFLLIPDP